jgi:phosphoribosyl-AMP cyclohydrolase
VHSESLDNTLFSPLATRAQRVFCFLAACFATTQNRCEEVAVNIDFEKAGGLVPAIMQDYQTGEVLMLGFMNAASFARTQESGEVVFFSRSRKTLWKKGESSGHVLKVREVRTDCDADALLVLVEAVGPGVCHEGYRSCFFRSIAADGAERINAQQTFQPEQVYGAEKTS